MEKQVFLVLFKPQNNFLYILPIKNKVSNCCYPFKNEKQKQFLQKPNLKCIFTCPLGLLDFSKQDFSHKIISVQWEAVIYNSWNTPPSDCKMNIVTREMNRIANFYLKSGSTAADATVFLPAEVGRKELPRLEGKNSLHLCTESHTDLDL